jgi:4-hydroxybenzoate polyprenyltransferase
MPGFLRAIHPAPAAAVVVLSGALAMILSSQAGFGAITARVVLTVAAVLGSQILTGAVNDWADRDRDRVVQPSKPIPSGALTPTAALVVAGVGAAIQLAASLPLGPLPLVLGAIASASAAAYNLALSRTPLSVLPYLVSFGVLPLWIASGVGAPLERVAAAPILVGPFAAAAHLANTVRDFDGDERLGSRNLAQVLGRDSAFRVAVGLVLAVGVGVGTFLLASGRLAPLPALLGIAGLVAVGQGLAGPRRLWGGMLIAAVAWSSAWALSTGPT